jgi:3-deoxy-D-manno-octulosonic-acid transferase
MLFLYRIIIYISLPVVLLNLLWRSVKTPSYRKRMGERFGIINNKPKPNGVWIHCVSVGETKAAIPLIKQIQELLPHVAVTVTCTTPTGSNEIINAFGDSVYHCYCPFDIPSVANRFLSSVQPKAAIMVETEIWPHLLMACHRRAIKTLLINGRMSQSSANGYLKIKSITQPIFNNFDYVAAQYPSDAKRLRLLGVRKENMHITGSVKFDISPDEAVYKLGRQFKRWIGNGRPIMIAASTHAGEDEAVLEAFKLIKQQIPKCFLIIVPRHPERFDSVRHLIEQKGISFISRSETLSNQDSLEHQSIPCDTDILLGDTMGELLSLYQCCDVAFVGGSIAKIGGHNILEAAVLGKPTVIGPHYFNFQDVSQEMINEKACFCVESTNELADIVIDLFKHPDKAHLASKNAILVLEKNRGSLKRLTDGVMPLLTEFCH